MLAGAQHGAYLGTEFRRWHQGRELAPKILPGALYGPTDTGPAQFRQHLISPEEPGTGQRAGSWVGRGLAHQQQVQALASGCYEHAPLWRQQCLSLGQVPLSHRQRAHVQGLGVGTHMGW